MLSFYNPDYLYWLSGIAILLAVSIASHLYRRKLWTSFIPHYPIRDILLPNRVGIKRIIKDLFILVSLVLLIIALARPQTSGNITKADDNKGIEAMICIDVSNSMLSQDIAPSRISFAKTAITKALENRKSDKIGIVVFAADAYVQLPITTDLRTAQEFLQDVSPDMLSAQGTDIAQAIELSCSAFSDRKDIGKTIVIVTDGESHEGGVKEAIKIAQDKDIKVSVIGIGSEEGGVIPTSSGYLKDENGSVVTTKLNNSMCQQIASLGKGSYIHTDNINTLSNALNKELDTLPKATIGTNDRAGYIEHYAPWVAIALIFIILELGISQKRNNILRKINLFGYDK